MRIVVTGVRGQLARSLSERAAHDPDLALFALGRPGLDLEKPGPAGLALRSLRPDVVINAAAYTAVDRAEGDPARAFRVNAEAAGELAGAAGEIGARFIQLSTDYVFDGTAGTPYRPSDRPNPLNVYGRSKLKGEELVRVATPDHLIVRTAWLYGPFGGNFLLKMLELAASGRPIRVVDDQRGSPTSSLDLADALLAVCRDWAAGGAAGLGRTLHVAGRGAASWAEFAAEVLTQAARSGLPSAAVVPIGSDERPTRAHRPRYSVLDSSDFAAAFGDLIPRWQDSARAVMMRISQSN